MFIRHLVAAAVVTASAGAVLTATSAQAAAPATTLGTVTLTPSSGLDVTAPAVHVPTGCPTTADGFNAIISGPGKFADGFLIITTTSANFSTTSGFNSAFRLTMKDAATDLNTTLQAGDYPLVVNCVDSFSGDVKGSFDATMTFSDSTHWHQSDAAPPTTTVTTTTSMPPTSTTTTPSTTTPSTTTPTTTTPTTSPSDTTLTTTTSTTEISTTTPSGSSETLGVGITSTDAPPPASGTSATPGRLGQTGGPIGLIFVVGLVLLAAGLALIIVTRRPRTELE